MKKILSVVIVILVLAGIAYYYRDSAWLAPLLDHTASQEQVVGTANFACDADKAISATFYSGPAAPLPAGSNLPPTPTGSVSLVLSDGRSMTLPQTISGSGIRYANADESFVFWSEGNTAFVTEGTGQNPPTTFANCIKVSDLPGQESWNTYASSTMDISVRYPQTFTLDPAYSYQELGPGQDILGVKLIIPDTMATGTNLSSDSYVSVEELPAASSTQCTATQFLQVNPGTTVESITDNGTTYSVASSTGAGAGNRYEEWAWAIPGTNPCVAVRYFIHYGVIENYPPGAVQQYDEASLLSQFDAIRESLVIGK